MKKNISLIGMPGSGKTSTAKELGTMLLNYGVSDIDELIEATEKLTIPEIFKNYGEEYFREKESETINSIYKGKKQIIALGGGAFENPKSRLLIKENSVVVYLKASPSVLFERIQGTSNRPLLGKNFTPEKLSEILKIREKNYEKSDIIIETDNKNVKETALEIKRILNNEL